MASIHDPLPVVTRDTTHPAWCDLARCTAADRFGGQHRSAPVQVGTPIGAAEVTVAQLVDDDTEQTPLISLRVVTPDGDTDAWLSWHEALVIGKALLQAGRLAAEQSVRPLGGAR